MSLLSRCLEPRNGRFAAQSSSAPASRLGVLLVTLLFSVTTIATMLVTVICLVQGTKIIHIPGIQVYGHTAFGMVVMLCGIAINSGL